MRKHLFYLSMVLVLTLFSACGGGKKGVFTPTSSGRAYEVLVVVEPGLWERPAGRALFDVLDSDVPGLPQSERSFRIMYTAPSNYDATLKLIRNAEAALGFSLIHRQTGGKDGGGSTLTQEGKEWLCRYEAYRDACKQANSRLYLEFFSEQPKATPDFDRS
jgi:molybdate transport repressor ModE-like protein